ncbi:SARP family transcriptional regulator [Sphaerisporangium album]|uniref:SARP family transcriptional regulator n=1 Tax=Sphaerisporangium album TaxID=509200 RepID=A0A367FPP5_9ACTN|nr:BTAD domain-containing putative transcriptional regulator [Sphaerisporangium album]RCG32251.1 SARP family transcriptional regulator [Sphaerisporangium album]
MQFKVLGPVEAGDGTRSVPVGGWKQRTLLGALLAKPNTAVSTEKLIDELWADAEPPISAADNLRLYIYRIRRALRDPQRILSQPLGYYLLVKNGELDAERFEKLVLEGRRALDAGNVTRAAEVLRHALDLWRGPAFAGTSGAAIVGAESARLDELRHVALEMRIEADLRINRHADLIPELTQLTTEFPLRERFRLQLMHALYRAGRQAEALRVYQDTRRMMVTQLGLEPGPELRALEKAILDSDDGPGEVMRGDPVVLQRTPDGRAEQDEQPSSPCLLPRDTPDLTGREEHVDHLCDTILSDDGGKGAIFTIEGRGGVGKTTLAIHVAHRLQKVFTGGQLYVDLHGAEQRPTEPEEVLARFLRAFDVPGDLIPEGLDERAEMYRAQLAGRRAIIVMDDAADEAQVQPLLPGASSCVVLVTSRTRLAGLGGASLIELDTLTDAQAVHLMERLCGGERVNAEPQAAAELVRLCGGLPLALRIIGARLKARPHWSLARMVQKLAGEQGRLDELAHGQLDIRASLALSYNGLDGRARYLFRLLGLLDAPDFTDWVTASLLDMDVTLASDVLEALIDARLVDVTGRDETGNLRYRFHDLVRLYARERVMAEIPEAERTAATERMLGGLLSLCEHAHTNLTGGEHLIIHSDAARWHLDRSLIDQLVADPLAWCESERQSIVAGVRQAAEAGAHEFSWDLAVTAAPLFEVRRHYDEWQLTHEYALSATRKAGNVRGEAAVLTELGELRLEQNHYADATTLLKAAMQGHLRAGDRHGYALAVQKMGVVQRLEGDYDAALRSAHEALGILDEVHDWTNKALTLRHAGQVAMELGRLEEAAEYMDQALSAAKEAGTRRLYAQVLYRIGELCLSRGETGRADREFNRVLAIVTELGDVLGTAHVLHGLGRVRRLQGRRDEAEEMLSRAVSLARETNDRLLLAQVLISRGELESQCGRLDTAALVLAEAAMICVDINVPAWRARALHALGDVFWAQDNGEEARNAWSEASALEAAAATRRTAPYGARGEGGPPCSRLRPGALPAA